MERRYSQTEREALAIVWGCERFHLYLYGADFEIVTDHKSLELIFNNPNSKPPALIQRWALRLQAYTFTVKYKLGPTNIADYLSRHPLPSQPQRERLIAEKYVNYLVGHDVPKAMTLKEINLACQTDPIMQRLRQAITTGAWPADDPDLMPFRKVQLELTAANDSDQDIVKIKQLLREKVWYPGIDKDVKIEDESCIPCQATGSATKPEPFQMTELPPAPWTRVSTDFCDPSHPATTCSLSWMISPVTPEVEIVRSTAATTIIPKLDRIFAAHGIPDIVKSDNGPPFSGHEFAAYADEKSFQHQKITLLWPAAKGEPERFMRKLSKTVKTSSIEGKNWKQDIQQFFLQYRATPHSTTGKSPAELLFGRPIKTKLPNVPPTGPGDEKVRMKDRLAKGKMKAYADGRNNHKASTIQVGDMVLVQQKRKNKLSSRYHPELVRIIQRKGSMVTVEKPDGSTLTRNISHVKKISKEATNRWRNIPEESEEEDNEDIPEDNPDGQNEGPE